MGCKIIHASPLIEINNSHELIVKEITEEQKLQKTNSDPATLEA